MTDYISIEEVNQRRAGDVPDVSDNWDGVLGAKISEICADIDRMVGQARGNPTFTFVADGMASTRPFRGSGRELLPIHDAVSVTSVSYRPAPGQPVVSLGANDWLPVPMSSTPIVGLRRVNDVWPRGAIVYPLAKWGFATTVPVDVREAAYIEIIRSFLGDKVGNDDRIGMTPFGAIVTAKAFTSKLRQLVSDYGYGGASLRAGSR